jgi:hypothetical protein
MSYVALETVIRSKVTLTNAIAPNKFSALPVIKLELHN